MGEGLVQIGGDDLLWLLVWCFTWSTLYFTLCLLNPKRSYEWHIRTVTLIHAILVSAMGAYGAVVLGPWPFTHSGGPSTPYQHFVITISLAYFLLDFSWCLYFSTEGPVMLVHHTMSIVGLAVCFTLKYYGIEMLATLFGSEITNPLLQLRWFLRETKNYHTTLGEVVDVTFMALFGLFRIGFGSVLLYAYFNQESTDWLGRLAGVLIYSIGWVFWISIVQYAIKKYKRRWAKSKAKESVKNGTLTSNNNQLSSDHNLSESSNGVISHDHGKENGTANMYMNGIESDSSNGLVVGKENKEDVRRRHVNGCVKEITEANLVYGPDLKS